MLFAYKYVPHQMEKMQEFIDFIFLDVWCKAPNSGPFRLDLFDGNAVLKEVMVSFYYSDTQGADFFYGHIERIYGHFAALTPAEITQFKEWYDGNNNVGAACANDPAVQLVKYADIPLAYKDLFDQLAGFFKNLYSMVGLAALKEKIGDIDEHYQHFMRVNDAGKCPFCGIGDIKGVHHSKRDAYDHYLPKALYPFNSINFRNLAPACHECNSGYKLGKDPLNSATGRRRAFYPYSTTGHRIELSLELKKLDVDCLALGDIQLVFGPPEIREEIETWKELYGIDERYKNKCCGADAKDWLEQVRIFRDLYGIDPAVSLHTLQQQTEKAPFANSNFLKKAFLESCQRSGVLSAIA